MSISTPLYSSDTDFAVALCRLYNKSIENLKSTDVYGRNFCDIDTCQTDVIHKAMNHRPWQPEY